LNSREGKCLKNKFKITSNKPIFGYASILSAVQKNPALLFLSATIYNGFALIMAVYELVLFNARREVWSVEPDVFKLGATPTKSLPAGETVFLQAFA
jgi:hypothetical protein